MKHAATLIVLQTTKVGEKSLVVHTLSEQWGRRSFITAAGPKTGAALQPLAIIDAEVTENPRSELWRLTGISPKHPLNGLRTDFRKAAISMFISEVLFRTIKDGCCEDGLAEWCEKSILTLDALPEGFANFHLLFLLELAAALGFSPSSEDILPFAGAQAGNIGRLLELDRTEGLMLPLSGEDRSDIASRLIKYLGFHAETTINIRSLEVLKELFVR